MNPNSMPGPGDAATFPPHVRRADPQIESDETPELDPTEVDEWANAIAHDPAELDYWQSEKSLDYSKVYVKIDSRQCDLFRAADMLRLRIMAGRHAEADCIARDMTDALAEEIAALLISGGM